MTFTCYKWLPLFELSNSFNTVYKWFDYLHQHQIQITGFVIMPNHVHVLLHFQQMPKSLNTIIGNAKRFMAYDIIKLLQKNKAEDILKKLSEDINKRESEKGQLHKVFEESFEAKECFTKAFTYQKLDYIHHNPISKKWQLVADYTDYEHSSASFYEKGIKRYERLVHVNDVLL